ncbi:MAG: 3-oxoacyl-[acyl-carrier-protein] synthase III C-terminal domain-containing protein [Myxococcales bacterium]
MKVASVTGLGTWLPEAIRTNDAWPESFAKRDHVKGDRTFNDIPASLDPRGAALVEHELAREASDPFLGAKLRHVADAETSTLDGETIAAQRALEDAAVDPKDVDLVLTFSAVPDRISPPSAGGIADRLGAHNARGIGMDAACASGVVQLEMARAFIGTGMAKVVLLVHSHLMLRAMPMTHPASPGLGDAASAIVVTAGESGLVLRSTYVRTHGEYRQAVCWVRGVDDDTDIPWWKAGGEFRPGSRQPEAVKALMRDTVSYGSATLREAAHAIGTDLERVSVLACVQPRGFLPGAIAEHAGLRRECAVTTYERIAHVGSCGPVFNLLESRRQGRLNRGDLVGLYGQGAGFTRAAALLEMV